MFLGCADTVGVEAAVTESLILVEFDVMEGLGLQIDQAHAEPVDHDYERIGLEVEVSVRSHVVADVLGFELCWGAISIIIVSSLGRLVGSTILHHLDLIRLPEVAVRLSQRRNINQIKILACLEVKDVDHAVEGRHEQIL